MVFYFFSFRKKAKCFAGDVGSVTIVFIILFLIGKLIITTENFSWIILLSVYGVDSVLTIIHRLMLHENIGLPHRKHMYQLMANELKMSHVVVSFIYMVVQAIVIVGYIICLNYGYWYLSGTVLLLSLLYICFIAFVGSNSFGEFSLAYFRFFELCWHPILRFEELISLKFHSHPNRRQ